MHLRTLTHKFSYIHTRARTRILKERKRERGRGYTYFAQSLKDSTIKWKKNVFVRLRFSFPLVSYRCKSHLSRVFIFSLFPLTVSMVVSRGAYPNDVKSEYITDERKTNLPLKWIHSSKCPSQIFLHKSDDRSQLLAKRGKLFLQMKPN